MGRFTFGLKAFYSALVVILLGTQAVSAADFPTVKELYGRYVFSGECVYTDMAEGVIDAPVPATTGYRMVVLPGDDENEVKILGFFGYGNGITATYNPEDGTLTCSQEAAFICANTDNMTGEGDMVYVDAGAGGKLDYVYNVAKQSGSIVITSTKPMEATYMNYLEGMMGDLEYAAGYTLVKENKTVTASSVVGNYDFTGGEIVSTTLSDAKETFKLAFTAGDGGKVTVSGLFGFTDGIEADFYGDGGIIVLPSVFTFSNGCFMGANEGDPDMMEDNVIASESAPYFYVEDGKLVSPCSFYVYGTFDEDWMMYNMLSFLGGEAVKEKEGDGVETVDLGGRNIKISRAPGSLYVAVPEEEHVVVYDVQGRKQAAAQGTSVGFTGLKAGLYLVKAGNYATKVVVE